MKKCLLLFFLLLAADIASKQWVMQTLPFGVDMGAYPYGGAAIAENLWGIDIALVYVMNPGAAWSLFSSSSVSLKSIRLVLLAVLLLYFFFKKPKGFSAVFLTFIVAGAVGNLIDGFLYGGVIDMIKVVLWGYHYPIFNLADSYIVMGAMGMIVQQVMKKKLTPWKLSH